MILRYVAIVTITMTAGSLSALAETSPCATAKRGTYLSNVCWLFDNFNSGAFPSARIVGADAEECTVSLRGDETVHLRRADGNLRIAIEGTLMCRTLFGERGIYVYPNHIPETWDTLGRVVHSNQIRVCGRPKERSPIQRAMNNLFTYYCPTQGQAF